MERILCIIIHFGDEVLTWNCINSIIANDIDIVVVDNDPKQKLQVINSYKERILLIKTGGKAGFSEANNYGVRLGRRETHYAVLFLNNDTVAKEDSVSKLVAVLSRKDVGAVGPCMMYLDQPTLIWACGGKINKLTAKIHGLQSIRDGKPFSVDYLPGAAILCRLDLWDKINGMSEKYFLAYEEAELAVQIRRNGYKIVVEPSSIVYHKVGMSSEVKPKYEYNSIRNRMKFGHFLWKSVLGGLWVVALTFFDVLFKGRQLSIWKSAILDEIKKVPLNQAALLKIEEEFK
jgi:GT2 family glycosyltransferase